MQGILDWGIRVVLWFQQFSPKLDLPFKVFTFMGEEEFFLLLLPLIFWCVDRRAGMRVTVLFLLSVYVNSVTKILAGQPRPFEYDPRVKKLFEATGQGFPSGHTQSAVVVWGYLAAQFRRVWLWVVAVLLIVFIPLSRVYLGAHFPTDLLGGYVIGALLLWLYLRWEPGSEAWLEKKGLAWQLGLATVVPLVLLAVSPALDESIVTATAVMMGMGAGYALERRWVGFEAAGVWWKRVLRVLLGVAVIFGLRFGLKAAFVGLEPEPLFRFVRYALIGLWGGLGAPWTFVRMRLAEVAQSYRCGSKIESIC
jgi:membrane-associated phospholipid phosphatase